MCLDQILDSMSEASVSASQHHLLLQLRVVLVRAVEEGALAVDFMRGVMQDAAHRNDAMSELNGCRNLMGK